MIRPALADHAALHSDALRQPLFPTRGEEGLLVFPSPAAIQPCAAQVGRREACTDHLGAGDPRSSKGQPSDRTGRPGPPVSPSFNLSPPAPLSLPAIYATFASFADDCGPSSVPPAVLPRRPIGETPCRS